jgi:protocatechuate 3,4-dioxygenase beta subunit
LIVGLILFSGCSSLSQATPESTLTPVEPVAEVPATPTEKSQDPTQEPTAENDGDLAEPASPTATPAAAVTEEPEENITSESSPIEPVACEPTPPDALGPFYVPGAPEQSSVGQGHLLRGVVRSSEDCAAIPGALLEFWLAGPDGEYGDAYRATLFAGEDGAYTFESNPPPPYSGRPPHIHLRVTADGYEPLVTQYYPDPGQTEGSLDPVLVPSSSAANDQPAASGSMASETPDLPAPTLFDVAWEDRSPFEAGLIEAERSVLAELPGATVYHLDLQLEEDMVHLQGQEEVRYTNREDQPLAEIYFRLFPNLTGGSTSVSELRVNGESVEPIYELEDSAMRVPLSPPLLPGERIVIQLAFTVEVPTSEGGNYGTFAFLDEVLALAHFYPMIAVYDDEGWNVEIAPQIGDVIYADSSFYLVRVTAPAEPTLVTSGLELDRQEKDGQQVMAFAAGPVRDFYLAASNRYAVNSRTVGETTINSYAPAELSQGAETGLDQAVQALQSFGDRFGPYPFTEFDLVSTNNFALGIEYPGIVVILADLYENGRNVRLLESVVAHEVAHQWFYSVVGNDQVDEPWVDEALTQYATLLYFSDIYGPAVADGFRGSLERRWNRVDGADIPIGMPVRAYTSQEYSAIVYGRGPLFVETLAEAMGQETFNAFLRDYYQQQQWGIATTGGFKELAEQHCNCDLTPLFETWVYDTTTEPSIRN